MICTDIPTFADNQPLLSKFICTIENINGGEQSCIEPGIFFKTKLLVEKFGHY